MVESTNVRAAEMTVKLSAVNRWCVTGTPVQRQLLGTFSLLHISLIKFLALVTYCTSAYKKQA